MYYLLIVLFFTGCNLVEVDVHQSARLVETKDGKVNLTRGDDVKSDEEETVLDIPLH